MTHLRICTLALGMLLALPAASALALEFKSASEPAILFDSPSDKGRKLFVIRRHTPVETIVTVDKWVKVREPEGGIAWIEAKSLSPQRTVIVTAARAIARQQPADNAPPAYEVSAGVVLEYREPAAAGWIRVQHREGGSAYLRASDVWGL